MLAAALSVWIGVRHRQLKGAIGKMIGKFRTHSFGQLRKRMENLCMGTDQGVMITVSD